MPVNCSFKAPFRRLPILDAIKEKTGYDLYPMSEDEIRETAKKLGIEVDGDVRIVNSELSDNDVIRRTILPTLLGFVSKDCDTNPELKMFEIGRVVRGMKEDGLCNERKVLSFVAASKTKSENQLLKEVSPQKGQTKYCGWR